MSEITDVSAAYDKQFKRVSDTETLLRDYYDKAYAAGVAAERERCAKIVEQYTGAWDDKGFALAAKIRKGE